MNANEIRQKFLDFQVKKGHKVIQPAPLVLEGDPTTLFTGSGMQPLLPYLLGKEHPDGKRLTDSQPSMRLQDIEDVGDAPKTAWSAFDSVSVRIRFDDAGINWEKDSVVLYRWNGSKWNRVGKATEGTHIGTAAPQSRYESSDPNDNWNIGWYAVLCKCKTGLMVIVR